MLHALAAVLGRPVQAEPGTPFLTFYDDATGERTELSYATTDNWVAKTANLLREGLDAQPGDGVAVLLPPHWQTVVVTLAVWAAGCVLADDGDVAFVSEAAFGRVPPRRETVALSLKPMAAPMDEVPPGVLDYAVEIPVYGDRFTPSAPGTAPAAEPASGRVMVVDEDPVPAALAALHGGGGVVLTVNADPARLAARAESERAH
ncbi:MAG TPA: TIGR03089 family protein [Frankiaceae bacterium]|jgi:uncharacterized protein (TIGR03089 family)|nr:TIGR03089 family protein [Frankiaceae bacterium]